jgi:formylmethanofuran dehydrogenase subunit E
MARSATPVARAPDSLASRRRAACTWALAAGALAVATACDAAPSHPHHAAPEASASAAGSTRRDALAAVARVHGGSGPWAVAGYRMGEHALERLGLRAQSFDLEVIHRSPREVQFSCIADGAAAATGASLGKLNLSLEPADEAHVETLYRRKSDGKEVRLRLTEAFKLRFRDVPRDRLSAAGSEVIDLPAGEVFEDVR